MKRIVLSSEGLNRYGYRVLTSGIKLEHFRKNPVMFFGHSTWSLPIGIWEDIKVEDNKLTAIPKFNEDLELGRQVKSAYEKGFLSAASIGFRVLATSNEPIMLIQGQTSETVTECELMETSIVSIPGNPEATVENLNMNYCLTGSQVPELKILKLEEDMSIIKFAQKLGLSEKATEEQVLQAIEALQANEVQAILQLGRDKGIVNDANIGIFQNSIALDADKVKTYFLEFKGTPIPETVETQAKPAAGKTLHQSFAEQRVANEPIKGETERKLWSYQDWSEKDPSGLKKLKMEDTTAYDALVSKAAE